MSEPPPVSERTRDERLTAVETRLEAELKHLATKEELANLRAWVWGALAAIALSVVATLANIIIRFWPD